MLRGHTECVRDATFNANGSRVVTASDDGNARIWETESGAPLITLKHGSRVNRVEFSSDGTMLASVSAVHSVAFSNGQRAQLVAPPPAARTIRCWRRWD